MCIQLDSWHKPSIVVFCLFFLVHLFYFILFIYMYVSYISSYLFICMYIFYSFLLFFFFSWFSLKHMIGYPQNQLQWEIVLIAAYVTQRKLNSQQIIAYPSEKQDNISKNKKKNFFFKAENTCQFLKTTVTVLYNIFCLRRVYFSKLPEKKYYLELGNRNLFVQIQQY